MKFHKQSTTSQLTTVEKDSVQPIDDKAITRLPWDQLISLIKPEMRSPAKRFAMAIWQRSVKGEVALEVAEELATKYFGNAFQQVGRESPYEFVTDLGTMLGLPEQMIDSFGDAILAAMQIQNLSKGE